MQTEKKKTADGIRFDFFALWALHTSHDFMESKLQLKLLLRLLFCYGTANNY